LARKAGFTNRTETAQSSRNAHDADAVFLWDATTTIPTSD
jgi:hypothetical protein